MTKKVQNKERKKLIKNDEKNLEKKRCWDNVYKNSVEINFVESLQFSQKIAINLYNFCKKSKWYRKK